MNYKKQNIQIKNELNFLKYIEKKMKNKKDDQINDHPYYFFYIL